MLQSQFVESAQRLDAKVAVYHSRERRVRAGRLLPGDDEVHARRVLHLFAPHAGKLLRADLEGFAVGVAQHLPRRLLAYVQRPVVRRR